MFAYAKSEQESKKTVKKKEPKQKSAIPNQTCIPDYMKARYENLSGFSFDDMRVHYDSEKPTQLQALAYTQCNQVYIAPRQDRHLGHELGHVVQQKQGRVIPTTSILSFMLNRDVKLEKEATMLDGEVLYSQDVAKPEDYLKLSNSTATDAQVVQRVKNPAGKSISLHKFSIQGLHILLKRCDEKDEYGWCSLTHGIPCSVEESDREKIQQEIDSRLEEAKKVARHAKSNGGATQEGFEGNRPFGNHEGKLPRSGIYWEYDVFPHEDDSLRGELRVILNQNYKAWFTEDHYKTFVKFEY